MDSPDLRVRELADLLCSDEPGQRASAAESLAQLGAGCRDACLELVRACGTDQVTREWAAAALEEMGPPPSTKLVSLVPLLASDSPDVVYWAATLLGRLEDQAELAADSLANVIESERDLFVRERAIWAARKIGCSSPTILQALNAARDRGPDRLARLATEALDQIGT
jgi:HEAT repeat protein